MFPTIPPLASIGIPTALAGVESRRDGWVQSVRALTNYDPLIQGVTMRLEPTGSPFAPATYVAEIVSLESPSAASVITKFRKARGQIAGVKFSGRKIGTAPLIALGDLKTVSPATLEIPIATPGVAEEWEIQARAYLKDAPVGIPSDFKTLLVRG